MGDRNRRIDIRNHSAHGGSQRQRLQRAAHYEVGSESQRELPEWNVDRRWNRLLDILILDISTYANDPPIRPPGSDDFAERVLIGIIFASKRLVNHDDFGGRVSIPGA